MDTDTNQVRSLSNAHTSGAVARTGTFVLHFLEMVLVMCIAGAGLVRLVFYGAALAGYPYLIMEYPYFSILMIGFLLAIPMGLWMRIRGHEWRPTLEMASTSIILSILLVAAAQLSLMENSEMLVWLKRLACPIMLIPMIYRIDLYTVHHGRHSKQVRIANPIGDHSGQAD